MDTAKRTSVVGVFEDESAAQSVVNDLTEAGISRENIHFGSNRDWVTDAATGGAAMTGRAPEYHHGGFIGWIERLFGGDSSDDGSRQYRDAVERGHCVVAVETRDDDIRDRVVEIMQDHDAIDIDKNRNDTAWSAGEHSGSGGDLRSGERKIPVVQEELEVGKRAVQRGGVRVYTHTVEEPVEEQVTLREEHVTVERRPADRPVTGPEPSALRDQTIEVIETAEEPVINKRARVVEEVAISKEARQREQTIRDKVRKQEVKTELIGAGHEGAVAGSTYGSSNDYDRDFQSDYTAKYSQSGGSYADYQPAYRYGYAMAIDDRFRDRSFEDVEETIKTDYLRNNPTSSWDRMRGAVRYGWERATGKR